MEAPGQIGAKLTPEGKIALRKSVDHQNAGSGRIALLHYEQVRPVSGSHR